MLPTCYSLYGELFPENNWLENIRISFFAVNYFQEITGYENVLVGGFPYLVLEGIKQMSQKISRKKLQLTTEYLLYICYTQFSDLNR